MAQKNFYVGHELKEDFERFCMENAYTEIAVMAAAFLAFSGISHEERVKWFGKATAKWAAAPTKKRDKQPIGPARGSARAKDSA